MDEDHFIYSRPVAVTEDRLKEALAKQAKQKALKAALDRQVLEAERLKAEAHRAKGRQDRTPGDPNVNAPPAPSLPQGGATTQTTAPAPPAAGPSPPAGATASHSPMLPGAVESTRYTFSFREGQGTFAAEGSSARRLQTTLPPSAEGRERAVEGVKPRAPARRAPSSREAGDGESGSRGKRGGGEYQTNSLPLNYGAAANGAAAKKTPASRERRVSDGSRPPRGASRDRKGGAAGEGGYDTQSLPVELIYKLSQANNDNPNSNHRNASPTLAKAPSVHHVSSPQPPPLGDRAPELHALHSPLGPLVGGGVPGTPLPAPRDSHTTPRGDRQSSGDWSGRGAAAGGRPVLSPRGAVGTPKEKTPNGRLLSPRPSARPAGGVLPPLHGRSDSDVIEMSAMLDAVTPMRDHGVPPHGSPGVSKTPIGSAVPGARRRTSSTPAERAARPSPPPSPRDAAAAAEQARKQAERERAWEQQVKQLKAELRRARAKGGAGKGGPKGAEARGPAGNAPRRAETAPDPPPHTPGRAAAAGAAGAGAAPLAGALGRNGGAGAGRGNVHSSRPTHMEKMDFGKAHIFTRENFRPITAPEDAGSFFSLPSPPPSLPPLVQGHKPKSREQARAGSVERDLPAVEAVPSPSAAMANTFASTATSADESLKLASLTTRQVILGLADHGDAEPVAIQFTHLQQFVEAQMITAAQAQSLWNFFALSAEAGGGHHDDADGAHRADAADDDEVGAAMGSTSLEIEVVDERAAAPGHPAPQPPPRGRGSDSGFWMPHSPTQPPTSAVLAPALRRKISQLHSEQEAALLLQQSQRGFHNGRRRPSPSGAPADRGDYGTPHFEDGTRASSQTSQTPPRRDAAEDGVEDEDEEEEEEEEGAGGTFDTYSELVLPAGHRGEEDD